MSLTFRPIPAATGQTHSIPLGLNNKGWAPITGFLAATTVTALVYASVAEYARKERLAGYLTPREGVARVSAPRSGVVTHLMVKHGDLVAAGDPLFIVDTSHGLAGGGTLNAAMRAGLERQVALLNEQIAAEQARLASDQARLSARINGLLAELPSTAMFLVILVRIITTTPMHVAFSLFCLCKNYFKFMGFFLFLFYSCAYRPLFISVVVAYCKIFIIFNSSIYLADLDERQLQR